MDGTGHPSSQDFPYCAQCGKSALNMCYPYLAMCNHLFCLDCYHALTRKEVFVCPLDQTATPSNGMWMSERLKALIREAKDSASKTVEATPCVKLAERMRREVRLDLVACRKLQCKGRECPYKHVIVSNRVLKVSNHIVVPPERICSSVYFEASEPQYPPKGLLRQSFLTDIDCTSDSGDEVLKSYLDLTNSLYSD